MGGVKSAEQWRELPLTKPTNNLYRRIIHESNHRQKSWHVSDLRRKGPCDPGHRYRGRSLRGHSEKDGYEAVQLGYEDIREAKLSKPELGHLNKAGVSPKKYLREFDLDNASELELGAIIKADTFKSGDFVDVTGTSKGHGYTGVIKRWNASRGRMTHGGGPVHRHAGSMGSTTDPSRIFKGKIGPGQYGVETVTIQNLEVVKVDPELNMLVVRGAVPGPKGSLVTVKTTVKVHKIKQAGADISKNPQKASGRNPQKASARNM